jgi:hypothetical protein
MVGVLLASLGGAACQGQYRLLKGETEAGEFADCSPKTPARICQGATGTEHCYAPTSDKDYIFGLDPKAIAAGQLDGRELTLFSATFSGCGSGALTHYSLLTARDGEFVNLLPKVELTNQSEYKLWNLPRFSNAPILATANFIWNFKAQETHFAHHRYTISVYVFDQEVGRYVQMLQYDTTKKYPGLDDTDEVEVLKPELPTILARLRPRLSK